MSTVKVQDIQIPGIGISIEEPSWLAKLLPANRIALISTWLVALGAFIYAIVGTLPNSWQRFALMAAALSTKAVTVLKYLDGSQKSEALQHNLTQSLIEHNSYTKDLETANSQLHAQLEIANPPNLGTLTKNQTTASNTGVGVEVGWAPPAPEYDAEPEPESSVGAVSTSVEYSDEPPAEMAVLPDDVPTEPVPSVPPIQPAPPGPTSSVPDDQAGENS